MPTTSEIEEASMYGLLYILLIAAALLVVLSAFGLNPLSKAQDIVDDSACALEKMERTAMHILNELVDTRTPEMAKRRMMSLLKQRKLPRPGYVTKAHLRCGPASVSMLILLKRIERGATQLTPEGIVHLTPTR